MEDKKDEDPDVQMDLCCPADTSLFKLSDGVKTAFLNVSLEGRVLCCFSQKGSLILYHPEKVYLLKESFVMIKAKLQEPGTMNYQTS
ncbi:hypothetical protein Tco_0820300 [Tanacetum coccineum]|uniref:Uncharacterized protein n=1 Tax=Tanacetum coccineum TaxID=301880 RepID=A0ABQ5ADB9_9ASTR